jgi:TIR domain
MNKSAVFLSYRRDDCAGYAGRLEDALEHVLGKGRVFRDIHDIGAGEQFADVIRASLAQAHVTLVLIGPRWQGPLADGKRRIDDPEDFVRMEVAAALASGNKVIPVLLSGASLPQTAGLPEPLRSLTRRQTLTLNETSWDADFVRLVESLGLPTRTGRRSLLIATLVVMTVSGGAAVYWLKPKQTAPVDPMVALTAETTANLIGTWETTSDVTYAWGDHYPERFEFKTFAGNITGTASFLKYARGIEKLSVKGRNISFVTHSVQSMNEQDRQLSHNYSAELDGDLLRIRLNTTGGFTSVAPIEFAAKRIPEVAP